MIATCISELSSQWSHVFIVLITEHDTGPDYSTYIKEPAVLYYSVYNFFDIL
jgi:hypothetical protein